MTDPDCIAEAAAAVRAASWLTAFTGAGISVESGIPPFRGEKGIWNRYDPSLLEINHFRRQPAESWAVIREIFYDYFGAAKPNDAHLALARLEEIGLLKFTVTQNIDGLHEAAGTRALAEFHGNSRQLLCLSCGAKVDARQVALEALPPKCSCGGVWKPDFVFFGEGIPPKAYRDSEDAARRTDCMLVIGSTGEVYPAALIPQIAKSCGARIIEINPEPTEFTRTITDIHIPLGAGEALRRIMKELGMEKKKEGGEAPSD